MQQTSQILAERQPAAVAAISWRQIDAGLFCLVYNRQLDKLCRFSDGFVSNIRNPIQVRNGVSLGTGKPLLVWDHANAPPALLSLVTQTPQKRLVVLVNDVHAARWG